MRLRWLREGREGTAWCSGMKCEGIKKERAHGGSRGSARGERNNAFSLFCFFFFVVVVVFFSSFSSSAANAARTPSIPLTDESGCRQDVLRFVRETPNTGGHLVCTWSRRSAAPSIVRRALSRVCVTCLTYARVSFLCRDPGP